MAPTASPLLPANPTRVQSQNIARGMAPRMSWRVRRDFKSRAVGRSLKLGSRQSTREAAQKMRCRVQRPADGYVHVEIAVGAEPAGEGDARLTLRALDIAGEEA